MTAFLLDTNHAIPFMHREEPLRGRIEAARSRGDQFSISITVLGELYYACHASTRKAENLARLAKLLASIIIWDFDHAAAEEYGRIQADRHVRAGKSSPSTRK